MELAGLAATGVGRCVAQARLGKLSPKSGIAVKPLQLLSLIHI
jgi:hypothetical protein